MKTVAGELLVLFCDDTIGISIGDVQGYFTPQGAVEIAQSLISAARDADPTLDVESVMKAYRDRHTNVSHEVH